MSPQLQTVSGIMNHSPNIHNAFQVGRALKLIPVPLLTLMGSTQPTEVIDPDSILEQIEVQNFELGDEILSYQNSFDAIEQSALYVVCRGNVRLLCVEHSGSRKLTVDLLETGAAFGLDQFFCHPPLAYSAIAATSCQVARIPAQTLFSLFQQLPHLQPSIAQQVQQRERLIFFRSLTHCCSMSSRQLKYLLLPHIVEQKVSAGTAIKPIANRQSGQFWLRSGEITSYQEIAPIVGESWGYLGRTPSDWVAQTDLVLYKVPLERLEAANLLDFLGD